MSESLLSVGIDLGTTTTQMILSRLQVENTAPAFSVPRMEISGREILYRGTVHFTPLYSADTIDAAAVRQLIAAEYEKAGIRPEQIQTGAVIITGETARKENAREVLEALSSFAGEFVVATAGPALESVLAARGAGADRAAKEQGKYVLHMDIGGGTSNLALFDPDGQLTDTGCLNVGGRLMKFSPTGDVTYVSPVLQGLDVSNPEEVVGLMVQALEEAAGLRPQTPFLNRWITDRTVKLQPEPVLLSFSGGVADLIEREEPDRFRYGDLGVLLGRAIARSALCRRPYLLGTETIRATVVGAGSYATELSGSTIFSANISLPLHDIPVVHADGQEPAQLQKKLSLYGEQPAVLAFSGWKAPSFSQVTELAHRIVRSDPGSHKPMLVVLEQDMAKSLGQALCLLLGPDRPILCIDGIHAPEGSYLDLAEPVGAGAALPVVVKTLAFI